jgi:hypothetical protein
MKNFDITDIDSWEQASDTDQFIWKDNTFFNEETGGNITEKEFTVFIGQTIDILRNEHADEKISFAGLSNIIVLIIDLLSAGISTSNVVILVNTGLENNVNFSWQNFEAAKLVEEDKRKIFNIKDLDSWKFASDNSLIWESKIFQISSDRIFSEILFVQIMYLLFYHSFMALYSDPNLLNLNVSILLDGLKHNKGIIDIFSQITDRVRDRNNAEASSAKNSGAKPLKHESNYESAQSDHRHISPDVYFPTDLKPPSYSGIVIGLGLLLIGIIMLFSSVNDYDSSISKGVFGFLLMFLSIIPFAIYSSAKSKFVYKSVCADMAQRVGSSSNDLIMKWGAPTRTYKFPSDKTMTVLEYKESIRNYASYSHKGYRAGQSKTTKYVKSFFVKDGVIVNYKYSIT